ncbi:MAG TPA: hypothetical protein VHA80_09110 [Solirubrobacterales bacterium]|nr:hypothetical protein [Solirubrobacterales bacterium]
MDAVEQSLRDHVADAKGARAFHYRLMSGQERFWPDAASVAMVRRLDQTGECQRVACEVSERFGHAVVVGWCLDFGGRPCWHCANVTPSGQLVDAGAERHRPGLLGKVLSEREEAMLARAARQPSLSELGERGGSLLG